MSDPPARVLVVEDDEALLELYREYLEADYSVRTASSGSRALELIDDELDVVLLDRRMPGMSGDEVLRELRERGFDGPIAMVTAVEPDLDIVELPFDGYVVKPVSRDDLGAVVQAMLDRAGYDEAVREYFALSSKVATLEAERSRTELHEDSQYQELIGRLSTARTEARSALASLSTEEIDRLFHEIGTELARSPTEEKRDD